MRFKEQFEFHKVPEWDEHYLQYAKYLEKIEGIVSKMAKYRLNKLPSSQYSLSESFHVTFNEDGNEESTPEVPLEASHPKIKDDSLSYSGSSCGDKYDLEMPLISLNTDVKEILEEFVKECKEINEFYEQEKKNI